VWSTATGHLVASLRNPIGYSIGGPAQDTVTVQAALGTSTLLDQDARGELILWKLNDIPHVGAWNAVHNTH
jgi:hypothetical protein